MEAGAAEGGSERCGVDRDDGSQADAFRDGILSGLAEVGERFGVPLAEGYRRIDGL